MSETRRDTEVAKGLGDRRGPVSGRARHCERAAGAPRAAAGQAGQASRRDAVLRVLMEAYRRDVGPSGFDPR